MSGTRTSGMSSASLTSHDSGRYHTKTITQAKMYKATP